VLQQLHHECPEVIPLTLPFGSQHGMSDGGGMCLSKMLLRHSNLRVLELGSQAVGDAGCIALFNALRRHPAMQSLHLEDNRMGDSSCRAFAAASGSFAGLSYVDFSYNIIGDYGCRSLSDAVQKMPKLQTFHVHANAIGAEALAELHCSLTRCCPSIEDVLQFSISSSQCQWPFYKTQP
jgi:Ran GTPase-activating protein (RanGAP) involved in mRNA processing and transport